VASNALIADPPSYGTAVRIFDRPSNNQVTIWKPLDDPDESWNEKIQSLLMSETAQKRDN